MKKHTWEDLSNGLSVTWCINLRNNPDASFTSVFDQISNVLLRIYLTRMVRSLGEVRKDPHLIRPRLIIDKMPVEHIKFRHCHCILTKKKLIENTSKYTGKRIRSRHRITVNIFRECFIFRTLED